MLDLKSTKETQQQNRSIKIYYPGKALIIVLPPKQNFLSFSCCNKRFLFGNVLNRDHRDFLLIGSAVIEMLLLTLYMNSFPDIIRLQVHQDCDSFSEIIDH